MTAATIWGSWLFAVGWAAALRNRLFAMFVGVFLGISALSWSALFVGLRGWPQAVAIYFTATALVHAMALARPRMRGLAYRSLVSVPGLWFVAGSWLAVPWALAAALGIEPLGWQLPYAVAVFGVVQSLRNPIDTVNLSLDREDKGELARDVSGPVGEHRPLRVAQITDPHLGPFMSTERLRKISARIAALEPDLVLITGDILTMESHSAPNAVAEAFAPLAMKNGDLTLGEARAAYFEANGFGSDGGYSKTWEIIKLGPVPIPIRNSRARVAALQRHDLHHVLTGYQTDLAGEAEISAWEIASGCADMWFAWLINTQGIGLGLLVAPRRTWTAFIRGRHTRNLYREDFTDELLQRRVAPARSRLGLDNPPPAATLSDRLHFAMWAGLIVVPPIALAVMLAAYLLG